MAVLIRQRLPPAHVRSLIQDPQKRGGQASAGLGCGVLLGGFHNSDGQAVTSRMLWRPGTLRQEKLEHILAPPIAAVTST